jgi:3-oxoacyl-[acyl-carrier-protein] synthase I
MPQGVIKMSNAKLYIAGMGMITGLGWNLSANATAINANKSAYAASPYQHENGEPLIMARVPDLVFDQMDVSFEDEGSVFNLRQERMIRLAILALRECVGGVHTDEAVPLVVSAPADQLHQNSYTPMLPALAQSLPAWVSLSLTRRICTGRAAGIEAIDFAFRYLINQPQDYMLLAGVDSCDDNAALDQYNGQLLAPGVKDGFAPGEGASALLLTKHFDLADPTNDCVIVVHPPGMAEEEGHMYSEKPYLGNGLDKAFKGALQGADDHSIAAIFSSMNGEHHWAKEYGVAYIRNKSKFSERVNLEHPADCYGDLGAATGTALVALAAEYLRRTPKATHVLVYSSADTAPRGALVLQKIRLNTEV